ncbi:hypothetical protein BTO30_13210 [Domibacillus antri]|uniref:Uncharacterized protein n=1 Tax=Domibacillus antri TaxID=1714264 RepID=A0A1Q8Q370_9BACI|nr:hypothetical protein [Domibacillus antri]OLN21752.1 hypothetical protein BTO30_13210 [Domibacillus antri]
MEVELELKGSFNEVIFTIFHHSGKKSIKQELIIFLGIKEDMLTTKIEGYERRVIEKVFINFYLPKTYWSVRQDVWA